MNQSRYSLFLSTTLTQSACHLVVSPSGPDDKAPMLLELHPNAQNAWKNPKTAQRTNNMFAAAVCGIRFADFKKHPIPLNASEYHPIKQPNYHQIGFCIDLGGWDGVGASWPLGSICDQLDNTTTKYEKQHAHVKSGTHVARCPWLRP